MLRLGSLYPMEGWDLHMESGQGRKGGILRTYSRLCSTKQDIRATSLSIVDQVYPEKEGPHRIKNGKQILAEDTYPPLGVPIFFVDMHRLLYRFRNLDSIFMCLLPIFACRF